VEKAEKQPEFYHGNFKKLKEVYALTRLEQRSSLPGDRGTAGEGH
jgi:hypothetical protein